MFEDDKVNDGDVNNIPHISGDAFNMWKNKKETKPKTFGDKSGTYSDNTGDWYISCTTNPYTGIPHFKAIPVIKVGKGKHTGWKCPCCSKNIPIKQLKKMFQGFDLFCTTCGCVFYYKKDMFIKGWR